MRYRPECRRPRMFFLTGHEVQAGFGNAAGGPCEKWNDASQFREDRRRLVQPLPPQEVAERLPVGVRSLHWPDSPFARLDQAGVVDVAPVLFGERHTRDDKMRLSRDR